MSALDRKLNDTELLDSIYPTASDWLGVRDTFDANGWLARIPLVDGLESAIPSLTGQHVSWDLGFEATNNAVSTTVAATVRLEQPPIS